VAAPVESRFDIQLSSQNVIDVVARMKVQGITGDLRAHDTPKRTSRSHAMVNPSPITMAVMRRDLSETL
jgi:hypothetical protein